MKRRKTDVSGDHAAGICGRKCENCCAEERPRYLRWQTSTGTCTAALLCVVIAVASIHSKMPDGTNQLEVVPPAAVTTAVEPEERLTLRQNRGDRETTLPKTASDADAAVQYSANTEMKPLQKNREIFRVEGPADTQRRRLQKANACGNTVVPQTSKPAGRPVQRRLEESDIVTTAAPVVTTLPRPQRAGNETVPIRQNIYLYYKLIWRNNPYDTNYDEVPGSADNIWAMV
ncbi:MAG: hypothetical protein ACLTXT_06205 [Ruminococcus callidus]